MKQLYSLIICSFFLITLFSCEDEDLTVPVPGYINIEDVNVGIQDTDEGSNSDNIKDAWVFIDDQLIGAFELPTTIPIQNTGNINLRIRGGIHNNGISSDREIYPFYEFYNLDTTIAPEQEIKLTPTVNYKVDAVFDSPWSGEDFESGINFLYHSNSDVTFYRATEQNEIFEGLASGAAILSEEMTFFEAYTPTFSDIPRNGTDVYLEMNYRCTHDIAVSIYVNNQSQQFSVINFTATNSWNKVYIDFSSVFSSLFNASNFNIAIGYTKPTGETGELFLDNVKLIHY